MFWVGWLAATVGQSRSKAFIGNIALSFVSPRNTSLSPTRRPSRRYTVTPGAASRRLSHGDTTSFESGFAIPNGFTGSRKRAVHMRKQCVQTHMFVPQSIPVVEPISHANVAGLISMNVSPSTI
ncbi:hypothetical protein DAEQUDRAFT_607381 [Daedalea quercina L-15889]|uniref:Uncharacterized protein n=1 Tax=Daedalea quercina L-15889 TaxID=1314783 RepID=A0A165LJK9_9APHY|nr:hypothetical protein DAEQUDRAFT_607381 [Daedalea quercina L-15889]